MKPIIIIFFLIVSNSIMAVKTPEFRKIISNEIKAYENAVLTMQSVIEVYNPNFFSLNFEELTLSFLSDEKKCFAKGSSQEKVNLTPQKSNHLTFEIKIFLDSMSSEDLNEMISIDSISMNCKVSGKLGLFSLKISDHLAF